MGQDTVKRTSLKRRGLLFASSGIIIATFFFLLIFFLREKISNEYTQRVSAIGTKLQLTEQTYVDIITEVTERENISSEKIDALEKDFEELYADILFINQNIFIYKEDSSALSDLQNLALKRKEQISTVRVISNYILLESEVGTDLKQHQACVDTINYKGSPANVSGSVRLCNESLGTSNVSLIGKEKLLNCSEISLPSTYIIKRISSYTALEKFYYYISEKKYPEAANEDKLFKQRQIELANITSWNICITDFLGEKASFIAP